MERKYYDGGKLLSQVDINGNEPEMFMCVSNRTAGKTTYFNRLVLNRWFRSGQKFMLVFRKNYDLDGVEGAFFDPIKQFFPGYIMRAKSNMRGLYKELYIGMETQKPKACGYAIYLNSAENLKRRSNTFNDVGVMLFDEFILESNNYLDDELNKFLSVHTSVARGFNEMYRRVPVLLIGNPFSMLNPYYTYFNIPDRLRQDTKYLRGNGWVFEQSVNEQAKEAQQLGAFNQAFADTKYSAYASEGLYLNDNMSLVSCVKGRNRYIATIVMDDVEYAVKEMLDYGYLYVDKNPDQTFPTRLAVSSKDVTNINCLLPQSSFMIQCWRTIFRMGLFRFKSLDCKTALLKAIAY